MCLILLAYRAHPRYELLLAANRDEFFDRPTAAMDFWEDTPDVLAGRDLQAGGTWLGITRQGRFAALTNYRDPASVKADAPSRGLLLSDYLLGRETARDYLDGLLSKAGDYNGFSLLLRDSEGLFYYSNRGGAPQALTPGLYGLSNHLLNTPWPKVQRGLRGLDRVLKTDPEPTEEALFSLLADQTLAADSELPSTGLTLEWERALSPLFIATSGYGTRSSTALGATRAGELWVSEKTWQDNGLRTFRLRWPPPAR